MITLALTEIRRRWGRFISLTAALALITFLVLILSALADGLFYGSTGAIRTSNADAYVFSADAPGSLIRSTLPPSEVASYRNIAGVKAASGLDVVLANASLNDTTVDCAFFGLGAGEIGQPQTVKSGRIPGPEESGSAAVDERLTKNGAKIGDTLAVGSTKMTIIGIVADASYQLQPSIWVGSETADQVRSAAQPETQGMAPAVNTVAIQLDSGTQISDITPASNTVILTKDATALAIPGVSQQKATLTAIIATTLIVAAIVVALFFALVVLEKRNTFAVLKAIGTSGSRLAGSVVVQAFILAVTGTVIGVVVGRLLGQFLPDTMPALFRGESLILVAAFMVIASVLGSLFSLRRISRIDPATAIGGG